MEYKLLFFHYGVALATGLLIGLQRQYSNAGQDNEHATGIRTFALIGLTGCAAAHISQIAESPLPYFATILVLGGFLIVNYLNEAATGKVGLTTKMSGLASFMIGGLCFAGQLQLAVALAVAVTSILSIKAEMHRFVEKITREDIFATLKFAIITAIVIPLLPNRAFGPEPFALFNPFKIWLLVVFISGISFIGYILIKVIGSSRGIELTGLLGGIVSSTAVTLSFTQRSKTNDELSRPFAFAIIMAWSVMYVRVIVAVAAINPAMVKSIWPSMAVCAGAAGICCVYLFIRERSRKPSHTLTFSNPFELGPAIKFGLLFTAILFIAKAAQIYLGNTGVYLSSFISGLADVDAIALTMARLSIPGGGVSMRIATQAVVIAATANTLLKGLIVMIGAAPELKRTVLPGYLVLLGTGVAMLFFV